MTNDVRRTAPVASRMPTNPYYLLRAAVESSTAAHAGNPVVAEIHIAFARAYLHRVLGREDHRCRQHQNFTPIDPP